MVSFGSVLSGIIAVVLLSIYGYFFITHIKRPIYQDMRFLIFLLLIAGLRMVFPFNLPTNITIPDTTFLVPLSDIVFTWIPRSNLMVYQIIIVLSFIIALVLLIIKIIKYRRFNNEVKQFTYKDNELDELLLKRVLNHNPGRVSALYTDTKVSPFIYGLFHPVIVVPKGEYSEKELSMVLDHELTHINQHDLLIKYLFNILTALFWWNPFIWLIRKQADNAIELSNDISLYRKMNDIEKTDYAALLVKTASFSSRYETRHSLSLSTHSDPLLKQRVNNLINAPEQSHTFLTLHICLMILIITISFAFVVEPYSIHDDQVGISFDMEEDLGASNENTYIIDAGNHYELYVNDEYISDFDEIPDEFKDYPVYTEKPEDEE